MHSKIWFRLRQIHDLCNGKDGEMRLCIEYKQLNKKIFANKKQGPSIKDFLDNLGAETR